MAGTLTFIVDHARTAGGDHQLNKALADFDFDAQRRLAARGCWFAPAPRSA